MVLLYGSDQPEVPVMEGTMLHPGVCLGPALCHNHSGCYMSEQMNKRTGTSSPTGGGR